jgi:hypothetical protein
MNRWAGAVLAPAMYALIDTTAFHWKIKLKLQCLISLHVSRNKQMAPKELHSHTLGRRYSPSQLSTPLKRIVGK